MPKTAEQRERAKQRRLERKKRREGGTEPATPKKAAPPGDKIGVFAWDGPQLTREAVEAKDCGALGAYHPSQGFRRSKKRANELLETLAELLDFEEPRPQTVTMGDIYNLCSVESRLAECIAQLERYHARKGKQ